MNEHLEDDEAVHSRGERELTLSTGSILAIFLGLVLLCGACFGVGYNMGRKSTPTPLAINDTAGSDTIAADTSSNAKPAPGSLLDNGTTPAQPAPAVIVQPPPAPKPAPIVRKPAPVAADASAAPSTIAPASRAASPISSSSAPAPRAVSPTALLPAASTPAQPTGSIMVQVAAVSHQEDADLLLGALRARGYSVTARPGATDGFIHVQVGPFSSKQAAEAMRQRLLADGYNAILK